MKPQLEQPSALQILKLRRGMDPNPLADDLRVPPLPTNATTDDAEDLLQREGPMLLMERPAEPTGKLDRQGLLSG
jgi:hypothetical protein